MKRQRREAANERKMKKAEGAMESIDSLDTITDIDTNRLKTVA